VPSSAATTCLEIGHLILGGDPWSYGWLSLVSTRRSGAQATDLSCRRVGCAVELAGVERVIDRGSSTTAGDRNAAARTGPSPHCLQGQRAGQQ